jgi:hypothetical protein
MTTDPMVDSRCGKGIPSRQHITVFENSQDAWLPLTSLIPFEAQPASENHFIKEGRTESSVVLQQVPDSAESEPAIPQAGKLGGE